MSEVTTISPIPVLPLSYGDALPILRDLAGPVVPDPMKGALATTYHFGPGPARVHVALKFDWQTRPLWDVIVRIPGHALARPVGRLRQSPQCLGQRCGGSALRHGRARGNGRSLATLLKTGWRPERTIVLAAWDGEEWGLLGSTEWAEKHADELQQKAVAYINSDTNNRGWLSAIGLAFARGIRARDCARRPDPESGSSVLDAWLAHQRASRRSRSRHDWAIGALGSGSDYTAFIDHLGLASLSLSYGGDANAGIYHSIYDSFYHYTHSWTPRSCTA